MALSTRTRTRLIFTIAVLIWLFGTYKVYRHYNYYRKLWKWRTPQTFLYNVPIPQRGKTGYIFISPYPIYNWHYGKLMIIDTKGKVWFQRYANGLIYGFRQWKINGHIRYSYIQHDNYGFKSKGDLSAGSIFILDSMLNTIKEVRLIEHGDILATQKRGLDLHDFIYLSDDHFITIAHYEKMVKNFPDNIKHTKNLVLQVPVLQEVYKDSVIWQWDASHFHEFYYSSREQSGKYTDSSRPCDYMHVNSLKIDPIDSNLIISIRHVNQIIKVSRKTGEIMWRLGGVNSDFHLTPEQQFLKQHDAKYLDDNKTIIFVDNGDSVLRRMTRVLEFQLDEKNKKVTSFKAFNIPGTYSRYMGSVDKYGDNYFFCGGSAKYMMMINYKTGHKTFELRGNQALYRAYMVDSIYGLKNEIKLR